MKNAHPTNKINTAPAPDRGPLPSSVLAAFRRLFGSSVLAVLERRFERYLDAYARELADAQRLPIDELEARYDAVRVVLMRRRAQDV